MTDSMKRLVIPTILAFACGSGTAVPPNASAVSAPSSSPSAASSATASASVAPTPTPIVVVAMQLTGGSLKNPVELKDDGTVLADGKAAARFVGAELQDPTGKTLITVGADDTIRIDGVASPMKFDLKDAVLDNGKAVGIADDGRVILTTERKPDADSGKMKFTGFNRHAARAAALIVVALATSKVVAKK